MRTQNSDSTGNEYGQLFVGVVRASAEAVRFGVAVATVVFAMFLSITFAPLSAHAEALAPSGCPVFHCNVEATGVVNEGVIPNVLVSSNNGSLGTLLYQGCSGSGSILTCLYAIDAATGSVAGTLKVLDASTLQPLWGSAGVPNSYNLSPSGSAYGQVPLNFSDGTIAAGDNSYYVHYSAQGTVMAKAALSGSGTDFGMTPISTSYGIVSQTNGVLTLIDLTTWKSLSTLKLEEPGTGNAVRLVSPSSGAPGVLYAVAYASKSKSGWLYSLKVNPIKKTLVVNSSFAFKGSAGASPVVVLPSISGLPDNTILLATPGIDGGEAGQSYIIAVEDNPSTGLQLVWSIPVAEPVLFTPTVDPNSTSLFYTVPGSPYVYQASLQTGSAIASFNIQTIGGFGNQFLLSGHLGTSVNGSLTTLLLGAIVTPPGGASTQYALAFQPIAAPNALVWSEGLDITTVPISSNSASPNVYTAAWNFAPSTQGNLACVVVVSVEGDNLSTIVSLCDH
jgi:hypothetical protein